MGIGWREDGDHVSTQKAVIIQQGWPDVMEDTINGANRMEPRKRCSLWGRYRVEKK